MLNPRDGLEERDDIFSFFSFTNNVILLDITNTSYNYIKLINTTLSLMIPMGGVKFSWPVARENLTEGSLSHGSQFLTEHLYSFYYILLSHLSILKLKIEDTSRNPNKTMSNFTTLDMLAHSKHTSSVRNYLGAFFFSS